MKLRLGFLAIAIAAIPLFAGSADACTCIGTVPPCKAYKDSSAVFIGLVTGASTISVDRNGVVQDENLFRFSINRIYKGVEGAEIEVLTGPELSTCAYPFEKGQTFLVYAYSDSITGRLFATICTRTKPLSKASEDMDYLRELPDSDSKTRLSGTVEHVTNDLNEEGHQIVRPMAGAKVVITGKNERYEVFTNDDGVYKIVGLPPGRYNVRVDLPSNLYTDSQEIEIPKNGCAAANLRTRSDGRISGRVIDSEGRAVPGVALRLFAAKQVEGDSTTSGLNWQDVVQADEEGRFEFKGTPPGRYMFGLNPDFVTNADYPYQPTYFPGTTDLAKASIIVLGDGDKLSGYDMRIGPRLKVRAIEGVLVWSDGRPSALGSVRLSKSENGGRSIDSAGVSKKGRFSLRGFEGEECWVQATVWVKEQTITAKPVKIIVGEGAEPIKVILPMARVAAKKGN